jgi:hypothetical protein
MKRLYKKEILRTGKWVHPSAPKGILEVTKEYLRELVDNFKKTPFVPVLRGHVSNIEAEKNPALILNKNINKLKVEGDKLYAEMEIDEKELDNYNDVSVSIDPEYVDKETGKNVGAVLRHVAAVVNPYIKGMEGFTMLSENDKNYLINLSEIQSMATHKDPITPEVELEETKVEEAEVESKEAEVEKVEVEETKPEISEESKEEVVETPEAVEPEKVEAEVVEEVPTEDSEKVEATPEVVEAPKEEVEASESVNEIQKLQLELADLKAKLTTKEAEEAYSMLLSEGRVLPSMKEEIVLLHENGKGSIDLADGSVSLSEVLMRLLKKYPVLVNLEEQGVNEVSAEVSEDDKIKAEIRELPTHAKKSDEEFAAWWDKYGKQAIADYKSAK